MSDRRIERLEKQVEELRALLTSVILSVNFHEDLPFESEMARREVAGERRAALNLVLACIAARSRGETPSRVRNSRMLEQFPVLELAQSPAAIDLDEAIALVADLVGSRDAALDVLKAHKAAGFGAETYRVLGL
ncbi:hypothetical protein [Litorihabitans aurantiacus]|uniref:Uncharacterized protein n=1 Tax=Litorihabitans aurantiacus TaxID=1930061 RepID=A0AA37XGS9_9MICO|nr:hypothetical protein [Litorihabitans aurantiacus]GMA32939.1 hypothetical protein GCM10025875_29310 [Litorihabitans aurantiacus]